MIVQCNSLFSFAKILRLWTIVIQMVHRHIILVNFLLLIGSFSYHTIWIVQTIHG